MPRQEIARIRSWSLRAGRKAGNLLQYSLREKSLWSSLREGLHGSIVAGEPFTR